MKTDNSYDVIVVGSGPGGATVAKEMAQRAVSDVPYTDDDIYRPPSHDPRSTDGGQ